MSYEFGPFTINVNSQYIFVEKFRMAPAEVEKIKHLIGLAGGMSEFKALIPIGDPPFTITFDETGKLLLSRADDPETVGFEFKQIDELIVALDHSVEIARDRVRLTPEPRAVSGPTDGLASGDIIEGRG